MTSETGLKFRYNTGGKWFKGNTHIHSTASDGGKNFSEIAKMYAEESYDFLYRTDHWVCSETESDSGQYPLLWLDGIELDGKDKTGSFYHVICLGKVKGITHEMGFITALEEARAQHALLVLAHPYWCGNSPDDALRLDFHGVEIYNHVCKWLNGKGYGGVHWNAMLEKKPDTLAFSSDDAHISPEHPGWNGGWIMVNAHECSRHSITKAIRSGNFYSTCGPELKTVEYDGSNISVTCSPVKFARLVGPGYHGARIGALDGKELTRISMEIPGDWEYVYFEVEDAGGRCAWTNTLFVNTSPAL